MIDSTTPLVSVPPADLRQAAIANALWATNLRCADPTQQPLFRTLIGKPGRYHGTPVPWDLDHMFRLPKQGKPGQGVSSCGIIGSGLLDRLIALPWAGCWYWEYPKPYRLANGGGMDIVSCLGLLGDRCGAKRARGERGRPGDPFCMGSGYATHVGTIIDDDGTYLWSVDGGQIDSIKDDPSGRALQRTRTVKRLWDAIPLVWVLDLEKLAAKLPRATWVVPEGWDQVVVPPAPTFKKSWQLGTVKGYQAALAALGYYAGKVDGLKWTKTIAAIVAFQADHYLDPDGVVGRLTRAALQLELDAMP